MGLNINKLEKIEASVPTYIDEQGDKQEIELTIKPSTNQSFSLENTTNTIKTYFRDDICTYAPVKVVVDNEYFDWTPLGVGFIDEYGNEEWLGRINNTKPTVVDGNTVVYKNVHADIDDEFIVEYGRLKHNTILNHLPKYNDTLIGKNIELAVDGIIDYSADVQMFVDGEIQENEFYTNKDIVFKSQDGTEVFKLASPVTFESNSTEEIRCRYHIKKDHNILRLQILVPYSWLADSDRSFPVAVDPTLTIVPISGLGFVPRYVTLSKDENLFIALENNRIIHIYSLNKSTNTLTELPAPVGGYVTNGNYLDRIAISPNNQFIVYSDYLQANIFVYQYEPSTGGFTKRIIQNMSHSANTRPIDIVFVNNNLVSFIYGASVMFAKLNSTTGLLSSPTYKSFGTSGVVRIQFSTNEKFMVVRRGDNRVRVYPFDSGTVGDEIVPTETTLQDAATDFDLSSDNKYIVFAITTAPYFCVANFNTLTGAITSPIYPSLGSTAPISGIRFSRLGQFIVTVTQTSPYNLVIYRFNSNKKTFVNKVAETINVRYQLSNLTAVRDYVGLATTQTTNFYRFYYEPSNNVFFKDESTQDYYSDNRGNTLMLIDFGTIVAGQTTGAKKVVLENFYGYALKNIVLSVVNPSVEFKVVISQTETPFVPVDYISYNGLELEAYGEIPFFVRASSTESSTSGGMFELKVRADKV
ncbi:lactonase family protein [Paenibacillus massiliensis]|uniref:hypothetical protein n=1 Tax=Paenibacillus massiliensis TaxID=225917 RepID=UPI00041DE712|nr:hypothetical protein [Paenibacillus massiliensis]